jgi:phosphoserine phosphatase
MLARLRSLGIKTLLLSSGFRYFTERLKIRLSLDYALSNTIQFRNDQLRQSARPHRQPRNSANCQDTLRLSCGQVIALGDGAIDLAMMPDAGVSIAYHAKPMVREKATYCFDYVGLDGLLNPYT